MVYNCILKVHVETPRSKQIISINGGSGSKQGQRFFSSNIKASEKLSPEGEMYGFGEQFRENRKMYFNQSVNTRYNIFVHFNWNVKLIFSN